ncbi:FAD binding domain-containing protein [Paenibacillus sp. 1P07SE]|uniref:FAD binding domain-containing protein n=1 Tax=Paenibacillus sp. 1P07SE TaxID=3132209 RepID=UPI0039A5F0D0
MAGNASPYRQLPEIWQPRLLADAVRLKQQLGDDAVYAAGATWLRTQWENGRPQPGHLISLEQIRELGGFRTDEHGGLEIGAAVTLGDCCVRHEVSRSAGLLADAIGRIAAPAVRNLATLGGNVCSRTGDALPALLAHEAGLEIYRDGSYRRLTLVRWLENTAEHREDLIVRICIPGSTEVSATSRDISFYSKLGRREAFTPSLVTIALAGRQLADGTLTGIRLALGGGTAPPLRLKEVETLLEGGRSDRATLLRAGELVRAGYGAATDSHADAAYRKEAAANLLTAHLWSATRF